MSFDVAAESYGRFMGRYSEPLAAEFVRLADPQPGQRARGAGDGQAHSSDLDDSAGRTHRRDRAVHAGDHAPSLASVAASLARAAPRQS